MPVSIPEENRRNRAIRWIAHHTLLGMGLLVCGLLAISLFAPDVSWIKDIPVFLIFLISFSTMRHDANMMCIPCMRNIPDNGGLLAKKKKRALRFYHFVYWSKWRMLAFILFVGVVIPLESVKVPLGPHHFSATIFLWVILMWNESASLTHKRLRPWCPLCRRWDEGGRHERTPDPDPRGVKTV